MQPERRQRRTLFAGIHCPAGRTNAPRQMADEPGESLFFPPHRHPYRLGLYRLGAGLAALGCHGEGPGLGQGQFRELMDSVSGVGGEVEPAVDISPIVSRV